MNRFTSTAAGHALRALARVCAAFLLFVCLSSGGAALAWDLPFERAFGNPLDDALVEIAQKIEQGYAGAGTCRVAVADFGPEQSAGADGFGRYLAEALETLLCRSGRFRVFAHHSLKGLIERKKLEMTDLYDAQSVRQAGRFEGVDAVLAGSYWDFGDRIQIIARLVDAETTEQLSSASVQVDRQAVPQQYRPGPGAAKRAARPAVGDDYVIEAYQIDDAARILVNGAVVCQAAIAPGSPRGDYDTNFKRVNISRHLRPGQNRIRFVAVNRSLPLEWGRCGYGFKLYKNNALVWSAAKKFPRSYDPDGVFFDQEITVTVEDGPLALAGIARFAGRDM